MARNYSWAKMLARVFKIDVTTCDSCGGQMQAVAAVMDAVSIKRYLTHVNLEYEPPPRAPPGLSQSSFAFEYVDNFDQSVEYSEDCES